jgi:hypothetical protein
MSGRAYVGRVGRVLGCDVWVLSERGFFAVAGSTAAACLIFVVMQ